jgi:hypothetical protein
MKIATRRVEWEVLCKESACGWCRSRLERGGLIVVLIFRKAHHLRHVAIQIGGHRIASPVRRHFNRHAPGTINLGRLFRGLFTAFETG